jgi:uncharacterized membrane protein (DUF373 family)
MVEKLLNRFKRYIVLFVLIMLMVVLMLATLEFALLLVRQILEPPWLLLDVTNLTVIFSFALMLLIGLELIESVEIYFEHTNSKALAEPVILIAIIAMARKVIILDTKTIDTFAIFGIAMMILALTVGYFLVRKTLRQEAPDK